MRPAYEDLFRLIEPLLPQVEKPSRYIDHEWGVLTKREARFRVCLMYPDTYEVGLPNQGIAILYRVLNAQEGISCERGYLPWTDMADKMRAAGVPLLSLEGAAPVRAFDVLGMHVPHEMAATNYLEAFDLAGIPQLSADRGEDDPIVIAGGPSVYNPEPLAPFIDAFLIGEGEEHIVEVCRELERSRDARLPRRERLALLARIPGTYVPALYDVAFDAETAPHGFAVPKEGSAAPGIVYKRVAADFAATDPLAQSVVPYAELVHDRLSIEVLRGCARGCRFCQAGITYRPVRERSADQVVAAVARGLERTGYDEVSLTSLSTTDHSQCERMLDRLNERLADTGISVSIPSQRLDSFDVEMAEAVAGGKKGGLTFAVEAGSQRLRDVINKNVTEEDLDRAMRAAFEAGWRRAKLYFMMGLPTETDDDIRGIARLADHVIDLAQEVVPKSQRGSVSVSVSVSVFVPKAHTPFQWEGQLDRDEVKRRQQLLIHSVRHRNVRVHYHDADVSLLEAVLSRGGRDIAPLIQEAWARGARFDAWTEHFDLGTWRAAAEACGVDLDQVACAPYRIGQRLPWEHTSPGVSQGYLEREYRRACDAQTTPDCTRASCTGCGICPTLGVENKIMEVRR